MGKKFRTFIVRKVNIECLRQLFDCQDGQRLTRCVQFDASGSGSALWSDLHNNGVVSLVYGWLMCIYFDKLCNIFTFHKFSSLANRKFASCRHG